MSQADITRLVVGEPFTLRMGRAVGQSIKSSDVSTSLQWRDAKWQRRKTLLEKFAPQKKPSKRLVLPAVTGNRITFKPGWLGLALIALAGAGAVLGLLLQPREAATLIGADAQRDIALPVVRAPENIRTVDQPFPPVPAEALQVIQTTDQLMPGGQGPALPIVAPAGTMVAASPAAAAGLPLGVPPPMPAPTAPVADLPAAKSAPRQDTRPSARPTKEDPKPPAVILDEMAERPGKPANAVQPAAEPKNAREPVRAPVVAAAAPVVEAALTSARGLIAITPDGKSAVFTDQATRLPKQFKAGDRLPNGDVIKSIDAAHGKVIAGTKEYSLD